MQHQQFTEGLQSIPRRPKPELSCSFYGTAKLCLCQTIKSEERYSVLRFFGEWNLAERVRSFGILRIHLPWRETHALRCHPEEISFDLVLSDLSQKKLVYVTDIHVIFILSLRLIAHADWIPIFDQGMANGDPDSTRLCFVGAMHFASHHTEDVRRRWHRSTTTAGGG